MVFTASWQGIGSTYRTQRGALASFQVGTDNEGESAVEAAQNEILSAIAKRSPYNGQQGMAFLLVGVLYILACSAV